MTRGGCKQLRSLILELPRNIEKIQKLQDAIAELKLKTDLYESVRDNLQLIQMDLEKVASKIIQIPRVDIDPAARLERNIDLLVFRRHVLERMGPVLDCFEEKLSKSCPRKLCLVVT